MPIVTWHRFIPSSDDDNECTNPTCGVVVSDDALDLYAMPCPAPACTDPGNSGPCVFVPGPRGPECAYCGAPGMRDTGDDEDAEDDEDEDRYTDLVIDGAVTSP